MVTPDRLGPYRVMGPLGRGGMGEVFEGFDERLERAVALKRVQPEHADVQTAERLRREARAVARLNHPAIVQVHDWVEHESGHWIVMERVQGVSLRRLLDEEGLSLPRALRLARDIASGLHWAHQAGIVHRDLKADNIMVTSQGRGKILDFGLAKRLTLAEGQESLTVEGKILGTVTAMSPEQALGHGVDERSDLFSFGTLLYQMVTGVLPFRAGTPMETLTRICTWQQPPVREIDGELPGALERLIDQLLQKEPRRRPSTAEVSRRLEDLVAEVAVPGDRNASGTDADEATWAQQRTEQQWSGLEETRLDAPREVGSTASVEPATTALTSTWRRPRRGFGILALAALTGVLFVWLGTWGRGEEPSSGASVMPSAEMPAKAEISPLTMDDYALYRHGMELLDRYDKKGNIDRAIEAFQRLLARNAESAPGHAGLARAYWEKHENESKDPQWLEQARAVAVRGVEINPFLVAGRISLGWILLEEGRLDEANAEFERVLELDADNADALRGLAERELLEGRLNEAESFYRQALNSRPRHWALLARLGSLLYRQGRFDEAELTFQICIDEVADSLICHRNLAGVYFAQGRYGEASRMFQRALEIRPTSTLYSNLGTLLFYQGLYPQAVEAFEQALATSSGANDHRLWANLADAYRWTPGRQGEALDTYRRATQLLEAKLEKAPQNPASRSRLALYLAKMEDCERALSEVEALGTTDVTEGAVFFRRASVLEVCDRREAALESLERALQGGYPLDDIKRDPELLELRDDPNYHRMVVDFEGR